MSDVARSAAEEPAPTITPTPTAWAIRPPLPDPKEAENISGAACYQVSGARKSCLLAGDKADTRKYAFFTIDEFHLGLSELGQDGAHRGAGGQLLFPAIPASGPVPVNGVLLVSFQPSGIFGFP